MKVSVCIPVYNVEKFIERCLHSIVEQTYKDLEIIIVNDCTPDDSMRTVNRFAHKDSRIKIINHKENKGLMMARRTAYLAASGDYITFCDSDDVLPSTAIETLLNEAIKSGADIISGNHTFINVKEEHVEFESYLKYGGDKISVFRSLLRKELFHNLWAKLYKRSLLQNYNYTTYDHFTNGEDACLLYQVIENINTMIHINKSVYYYYQNLESSTQTRLSENALRSIAVVNKHRAEICNNYCELQKDVKRYIYITYMQLKSLGYNKGGLLDTFFNEYNLQNYTKCSENWSYLSPKDIYRMVIDHISK